MDNMELWNKVCKTDPSHTKEVNFGRKITAIDPYRQIENATRVLGPVGVGWGWEVKRVEYLPTNEVCVLVSLWHSRTITGDGVVVADGRVEQWGQASLYIDKAEKKKDTDCMKKATTDGITKCLSFLGFNADIFLGKFDDNKYVQERAAEAAKEKQSVDDAAKFVSHLADYHTPLEFYGFMRSLTESQQVEVFNSAPKGRKTEVKDMARAKEMEGAKVLSDIKDVYASGDQDVWQEAWAELTKLEQDLVNREISK